MVKNSGKQCDKKYCEGGGVVSPPPRSRNIAFFLWPTGV